MLLSHQHPRRRYDRAPVADGDELACDAVLTVVQPRRCHRIRHKRHTVARAAMRCFRMTLDDAFDN